MQEGWHSTQVLEGSNRTFMELKYNTPAAQRARYEVLIVPLWN